MCLMPSSEGEFVELRVNFYSSSVERETVSSHKIYCKKHVIRQEDPNTPSRRTLFSLGWPPYCSGNQVEAVFSRAGIVTATYLQQTAGQVLKEASTDDGGRGGRVAYVVFSQPEELERALAMCAGGEGVRCEVGVTGMASWCEEYASGRPTLTELDAAASLVVGQYDRRAAQQQNARKRFSEPDADGWVTVRSSRPQPSGHRNIRKHKKDKKLLNFYQFQQRESKREAVAELRRKFHKDKERVAELRAQRRFRPF